MTSDSSLLVVENYDTTVRIEAPGTSEAQRQAILFAYRAVCLKSQASPLPDRTTWRFTNRWWVRSRYPRRRSVS